MPFLLLILFGVIVGCSETKLAQAPLKAPLESSRLEEKAEDEQVAPPANIAGTWLRGSVLKEALTEDGYEVEIGLVAYSRGQRVTAAPMRYDVAMSVSASTHPEVRAELEDSGDPEHDGVIRVTAPTHEVLKAACQELLVFVSVVDKVDGISDAHSQTIASLTNTYL